MQVSPPADGDEPEVLNTPKSVATGSYSNNNNNARTSKSGIRARNLFSKAKGRVESEVAESSSKDRTYANMPPIIITDM